MQSALLVLRLLFFAMFTVAGISKLADRRGSRQTLIDFGLPSSLATAFGAFLPMGELAVALALIPPTTAWWGAIGALALLLIFVVGIGFNLARGRTPDCHCFGQLYSAPVGWPTLTRNGALAALAGWLVWRGPGNLGPGLGEWAGGLTVAQAVGLSGASVVLAQLALGGSLLMHLLRQNGRLLVRLDAIEVRVAALDHGTVGEPDAAAPLLGLPVGSPAPDFRLPSADGRERSLEDLRAAGRPVLLIFSDPDCGPCRALLPDISLWQRRHDATLNVAVISGGTPEENLAKVGRRTVRRVLLQRDREVADAYQCAGSPGAVLIDPEGRIDSRLAMGADSIRALVRRAAGDRRPLAPAPADDPDGSAPQPSIPIGDPAPPLSLPGLDGGPVELADLRGRPTLLLFWNSRCGYCAAMRDDLKAWDADPPEGVPRLLVVASGPAELDRGLGLRSPIVLDPDFQTGRAFGAAGTPAGILIDAQGRVASAVVVGAEAVLALAGRSPAPAAAR